MNHRLAAFLLPKHRSGLYYGALIGAGIGLFILLLAVQTYLNFTYLGAGGGSTNGSSFIQINKPVNFLSTLGAKATFSEEEMDALQDLAAVEEVGAFQSNNFKVGAASSSLGFYTELFFEAVPDDFLDLQVPAFQWRPGDRDVPIILSRDYLALYNFGFAPSQGLPQFTPSTIKRVGFELRLQGNGVRGTFSGRIVGFSDRINSILVPIDFLEYANKTYGDRPSGPPSRLILQVSNPQDQGLLAALEEKGYELSTGQVIGAELQTMVRLLLGGVLLIGGLILLLAVFVFILNFQLLITRSQAPLQKLHQLGYAQSTLASVWRPLVSRMAVFLPLVCGVLLLATQWLLARWMATQGLDIPNWPHWLIGLLVLVAGGVLYWSNMRGIRAKIHQLTVPERA